MNAETSKLLTACRPYYTWIAINIKTRFVPDSSFYSDGVKFIAGYNRSDRRARIDIYPAIWKILPAFRREWGAGNGHSHQAKTDGLTDGIYKWERGRWRRVDR